MLIKKSIISTTKTNIFQLFLILFHAFYTIKALNDPITNNFPSTALGTEAKPSWLVYTGSEGHTYTV